MSIELEQLIETRESYRQALLKKVNLQTPQPPPLAQTEALSVDKLAGTSSEESG